MIVAVGSGKGSPGATTLAALLGLCWPADRLVCELDPDGADLPYRLAGLDGRPLAASPSIATVAVESRPGSPARPLELFAQQTALGLPVIAGETSTVRFARLAPHLPAIAQAAAGWAGTVIADLGRLAPSSPAMALARAASTVVLVVRADTEGLGHLRERIEQLPAEISSEHRTPPVVGVVVRAERGGQQAASGRVAALLGSIGSPAPLLGVLADDPPGATRLWSGPWSRRLARSRLVGSARTITGRLLELAPELLEPAAAGPAEHTQQSPATAVAASVEASR